MNKKADWVFRAAIFDKLTRIGLFVGFQLNRIDKGSLPIAIIISKIDIPRWHIKDDY